MTREEVKEELQKYCYRYQELEAIRDNITFIKTSMTPNYSESDSQSIKVNHLIRLVELHEKLYRLSYEATCCNVELLIMIALIDDPRSRTILIQKHIKGRTTDEIMKLMNVSKSTYQRWHEKAVDDLVDVLKDEPK